MRGGKRKNAGRKPGVNKIPYATKLPKDLVAWLRTQPNQAQAIEKALRAYYDIENKGAKDGKIINKIG